MKKSLLQSYFSAQTSVLHHLYLAGVIENHNPDTGYNREKILIDWLEKHLPQVVEAKSGGKIIDSNKKVSKQVDVVIYEKSMPMLGGNDKTYYFAEGVVSALEVKSKLTPANLKEAFTNLSSVKQCKKEMGAGFFMGGRPREYPLTGIFAFDTTYKNHKTMQKALDDLLIEFGAAVDFVCVNGKVFFLYSDKGMVGVDVHGNETQLPKGFAFISNEEETIWRMLFVLTKEARSAVSHSFNMLGYFMKGKDGDE